MQTWAFYICCHKKSHRAAKRATSDPGCLSRHHGLAASVQSASLYILCQISMCCRQGDDAPSASPFGGSLLCTQGKKSASSVGYGVPVITTRTFFRLTSPNTQCSEGRMCSFLWKALVRMPCVRRDCSKTPHILKSENSHQGLAGTGRVGGSHHILAVGQFCWPGMAW